LVLELKSLMGYIFWRTIDWMSRKHMPKKAEPTGFGQRLKELREAAGLTQQELAEKVGFHKLSIAKLEQGIREPTWSSVKALGEALGINCDEFSRPASSVCDPRRGRPPKPKRETTAPKRPRGRPRKEK
jgi:DNA-binding XRE family transcriptional regulator